MNSTFIPLPEDQQSDQLIAYWQTYQLQMLLQRMQANLNILNAPPNITTVTVSNTTLYALAMIYYGDATQWVVIANANNLIDPQINTIMTLVIPPNNQVETGGIL